MKKSRLVTPETDYRRGNKRLLASLPMRSEGLPAEVIAFEASDLLEKYRPEANGDVEEKPALTEHLSRSTIRTRKRIDPVVPVHTEIELEIEELSSTGDGLAYSQEHDHVFVVPFAVPGDRVLARTYPQIPNRLYTLTDNDKLLRPSEKREGVTPGCKYFGKCSGCQLQMLSYEDQLRHKKSIVEQAFRRFSNLEPSLIPPVGDTVGSPIQYGYRTKLTPHFGSINGVHSNTKDGIDRPPSIGFNEKGRRAVMDIEQCPIGTPIINEGMKIERRKIHRTFESRKKGMTILLRESTQRTVLPSSATGAAAPTEESSGKDENTSEEAVVAPAPEKTNDTATFVIPYEQPLTSELTYTPAEPTLTLTYPTHKDVKTYTTRHLDTTTEYVGDVTFRTIANAFFQNNNSILPTFISYVREQCSPPDSATSTDPPIKYLLDAYCGSGLFAVCLAPAFSSVLGIDVDAQGIEAARHNAHHNKVPNAGFVAADAGTLFLDVPFPPEQSLLILDPPRKGASHNFLQQLCDFGPRRVIYISCNVHTQARDVGLLVQGFGGKWRYEVESLRGFDFFPQTGHVEGVCVLTRVMDEVGLADTTDP
ncbi:uncharacterized protein A1O9_08382 [Exophiala aquamarina CBS 119918]|uniref:TRAM domain-containing protein n=1 Tax=Exophiala aquamarina CBS 119918 TaxID=1182545 RepID=A0A072P7D2_9EURO|nr:uncharacterized protein A1O9_08382 [Exophiala aquamarina CBS 119918]KEF55632.1 hypothetical protein A1O9_08382 [Exophiala aquamarina CBS 119918]